MDLKEAIEIMGIFIENYDDSVIKAEAWGVIKTALSAQAHGAGVLDFEKALVNWNESCIPHRLHRDEIKEILSRLQSSASVERERVFESLLKLKNSMLSLLETHIVCDGYERKTIRGWINDVNIMAELSPQEPVEKSCVNCIDCDKRRESDPCHKCVLFSDWKPKPEGGK